MSVENRTVMLGNGSVNMLFARKWLNSRHVKAATETHATI
jgi:hypothetical protein